MPKQILWFINLVTGFFLIGINSGDLTYLLNLGATSWVGVA
jgi:hypothetical protein